MASSGEQALRFQVRFRKVIKSNTVERYSDPAIEASVARIEAVAHLMDDLFAVPGTKIRVGLDSIIGLVPVVGDLISQAISSYIIWEARQLGVSRFTMGRMIANSAIDTVVGIVPFAGDAFDVAFRANRKNLTLLKGHLAKHGHVRRSGAGVGPVIDVTARRVA
ncbi:DUF4112 domain-containing protein [Hyphomicrobium sp.]|uniref:DUF4112 domain-containing protein n=1 Tax=Hyphomicrobium sp. TaxID=82 RepID=UPI002E3628F0|nr:DUF4112 domain-containing protein [Hyphomicrobium sp.]HEX2839845.1 DUF4112 domain-containing protein [Hyphomicrobium sp.]